MSKGLPCAIIAHQSKKTNHLLYNHLIKAGFQSISEITSKDELDLNLKQKVKTVLFIDLHFGEQFGG